MKHNLADVSAKLNSAVYCLATSPEDLRGRLPRVYLVLTDLSKTDFPEVLQEHYDWVMRQLTARQPCFIGDTAAQASVSKKHNKTLIEIAERIVYISDHWHSIVAAGEWPMASTDEEMEDKNG